MGIDLQLLPMDAYFPNDREKSGEGGWGYSHSMLEVPRDYILYDSLRACPSLVEIPPKWDISTFATGTVPDGSSEGETMYGTGMKNPYGSRLTWCRAGDLYKRIVESKSAFLRTEEPWAQFVRAMKPDTMIILYWH